MSKFQLRYANCPLLHFCSLWIFIVFIIFYSISNEEIGQCVDSSSLPSQERYFIFVVHKPVSKPLHEQFQNFLI